MEEGSMSKKKGKEAKENITRRVIEDFPVRHGLKGEDAEEITKSLLLKLTEEDELRKQAKDTQSTFRKKIKDVHTEAVEFRATLELGKAVPTKVTEIKDFDKEIVKYCLVSNGKEVERRDMTQADHQGHLEDAVDEDEETDKDGTIPAEF